MNFLERSMRLCGADAESVGNAPFYPQKWTTALAVYMRDAFTRLPDVIRGYNSPRLFYKDNPAVSQFLKGLRFENGCCGFRLKDNAVYSDEIPKREMASERFHAAGWQKEIFFVMKLGYALEGVPSEHVHILTKYAESGNLYSNLPALYPAAAYDELTSGHIKNPVGVISEVLNVNFEPLTMDRLTVPSYTLGEEASEVYLPAEDKVAVLPAALVDRLTTEDIFEIKLKDNILCLSGRPLHDICGKYGVYRKGALNLYNAD